MNLLYEKPYYPKDMTLYVMYKSIFITYAIKFKNCEDNLNDLTLSVTDRTRFYYNVTYWCGI